MTVFPLVYRDLARALRHRDVQSRRMVASVVPVIASIVFLLIAAAEDPRIVGRFLFVLLLAYGLAVTTFAAGQLPAELFAEERRNGTLGLLYIAGLNSFEIFSAKLAGGLMTAFSRLFALFPCLLLPAVMNAVPLNGCLMAIEALCCWTCFCLANRVLASCLLDDESAARLLSEASILILGTGILGVSALNLWLTGAPLANEWLILSPAKAFWDLFAGLGFVKSALLHWANLITLLAAFGMICVAASVLSRSWQEPTRFGSNFPLLTPVRHYWKSRRAKLRQESLSDSPYTWLAGRSMDAFAYSWITFGALLLIWLLGVAAWSDQWLVPITVWVFALLIGGAVRWTMHYAVARQIGEDRRERGLELLLTTPLTPGKIVGGVEQLLYRHARPLQIALALTYLVLFVLTAWGRSWNSYAWGSYLCISTLVFSLGPWTGKNGIWTTFWVTLNVGRPAFALQKYIWQGGGILSIGVQGVINAKRLARIPDGSRLEFLVCAGMLVIGALIWLFATVSKRQAAVSTLIGTEFRRIATEPVPSPGDPRLKDWNVTTRLFKDPELPQDILITSVAPPRNLY